MKYKIEDIKIDKLEEELNEQAEAGWEFVTIIRPKGFQYEVLFKTKIGIGYGQAS